MKPTMTWLKVSDGAPEFEEVRDKIVLLMWGNQTAQYFVQGGGSYSALKMSFFAAENFIIIDPPVEEPLEYKGVKPEVYKLGMDLMWYVDWNYSGEFHRYYNPDKGKAIAKWNRDMRGE